MSNFVYQPSEDSDFLMHHGIKGQKWGVENGPPYPLGPDISTGKKLKPKVVAKQFNNSVRLLKDVDDYNKLHKKEYKKADDENEKERQKFIKRIQKEHGNNFNVDAATVWNFKRSDLDREFEEKILSQNEVISKNIKGVKQASKAYNKILNDLKKNYKPDENYNLSDKFMKVYNKYDEVDQKYRDACKKLVDDIVGPFGDMPIKDAYGKEIRKASKHEQVQTLKDYVEEAVIARSTQEYVNKELLDFMGEEDLW